MRIAYGAQVDALSPVLAEKEAESSREVAPGLTVSFDGAGRAVVLEVLQARGRLGPAVLAQIVIDLSQLTAAPP